MIGKELGLMKLEHVINKAVFIAPKVYGLITEDGKEIIKVKGLKPDVINTLNISDLEALLIQDSSREFTQEKWNKLILEGDILTNDQLYTLKVTSNKIENIYVNNIFSNTKSYHYNDIISELSKISSENKNNNPPAKQPSISHNRYCIRLSTEMILVRI